MLFATCSHFLSGPCEMCLGISTQLSVMWPLMASKRTMCGDEDPNPAQQCATSVLEDFPVSWLWFVVYEIQLQTENMEKQK